MPETKPERVELVAMRLAKEHFNRKGFQVEDVARTPGHNGYDLIVTRAGENQTIEVKGCSILWQIPDLFATEFDSDLKLVADILCVVYLVPGEPPQIAEIPRAAIEPQWVQRKTGYRISSKFKKESMLRQYLSRSEPE